MAGQQEPTWRVYLREWLPVYTADLLGELGIDDCLRAYRERYEGRVRPEDWQVTGSKPARLELRRPNLRGEFKDRKDAMALDSALRAGQPDGAVKTVQRGSDEERELLDYGKKMLPG